MGVAGLGSATVKVLGARRRFNAVHPNRAASAATCPASAVTKVLRPVIADISDNSPFEAALRFDVMRLAVV